MSDWLLHHETSIRLGFFLIVLLAMMAWEWRRPRRSLILLRVRRWPANFGLIAVDTVVLRLLFPLLAVGTAQVTADKSWGCLLYTSRCV